MRGYLGNQARNRPGKGNRPNRGNDGNRDRGNRISRDELPQDDPFDTDDVGVISPAELAASRQSMNLTQLKLKPVPELV